MLVFIAGRDVGSFLVIDIACPEEPAVRIAGRRYVFVKAVRQINALKVSRTFLEDRREHIEDSALVGEEYRGVRAADGFPAPPAVAVYFGFPVDDALIRRSNVDTAVELDKAGCSSHNPVFSNRGFLVYILIDTVVAAEKSDSCE